MSEEVSDKLVKITNQLTSKYGGEVCKQISPEADGLMTWICVYRNPPSYTAFALKKFSIPSDIDYGEYDVSDNVMTNLFEIGFETIEQVEQNIKEMYGEELSTFQSADAAGCPF